MRKTYALLIAGDESPDYLERFEFRETQEYFKNRHLRAIQRVQDYLIKEASYNQERIWIFFGGDNGSLLDKAEDFLKEAKKKAPEDPVIIVYCGHGNIGKFSPANIGKNREIAYESLARLCEHETRFLFVNNCCFSGSAIPIFTKQGTIKNGSVITCTNAEEAGYGDHFLYRFLETMRSKKIFSLEKIESHTDVEHDHHTRDDKYTKSILSLEKKLIERAKASGDLREMLKLHVQHPQRAGLDLDHLLFPQ